jgi:hypothetical protein
MERHGLRLTWTAIAFCAGTTCLAAEVITAPSDDPAWGKAADNRIFAQTLINEALAGNPNLYTATLHALAPGAKGAKDYMPQGYYTMIAGNFNRIGKKDSPEDVEVATENKTIMFQKIGDLSKFEVLIPQKDASNRVTGALVLVYKNFNYGDSEEKLYLQSVAIRDGFAKRLSSAADFFKPTP